MSNTRRAAEDAPMRQERYCSSPEYSQSLAALPVAKRCELIYGKEFRDLIWFLQFRSLPNRDGMRGRIGSVRAVARELLLQFPPPPSATLVEDFTGCGIMEEITEFDPLELAATYLEPLAAALMELSLNPEGGITRLPGLGDDWGEKLAQYRESCIARAASQLVETSVSKIAKDALEFTLATGKASLIEGQARTGKSETARAFCECYPGIVRYVEVPATNDEKSLYKAVAETLGVANGASYTGLQIRERVEEVLRSAKFMLVFDEAHNLWPRRMRPTSVPTRVLWVMSLMNLGVPVAFVALPEFSRWMDIVAEKTAWEKAQIEGRIARRRMLPEQLTEADLHRLARVKAPELSEAGQKVLVSAARLHPKKSAAVVVDAIASARYIASRRGASAISFEDLRQAIADDWVPIADAAPIEPAPSCVASSAPAPGSGRALPSHTLRTPRATPVQTAHTSIAAPAIAPATSRQVSVDVPGS